MARTSNTDSKSGAKTTGAKPGRLSQRFWKLLGASSEKNQTRSMSEVARMMPVLLTTVSRRASALRAVR